MNRAALFILLLSSALCAHSQAPVEVLSPLAAGDVTHLLQGASVEFSSARGNRLSWRNDPDGTMMASSAGPSGRTTRKGNWKIDDKGRFCVFIAWPTSNEEWCRYVVKEGDLYYITRANGERISRLLVAR
jgi:hypothetical protein